ncbi:Apoptosis-inducing factor B [Hypsizygus marmoreus]|uniref:Apoptosis-inducing factor B n=1 Tax=Hypsizygus marmoreus TaxID=39966 RepID=A0A369KFV4_HYPMA|nr:Apoptosis-inducing factor B [Hypsizygus marmoreus]
MPDARQNIVVVGGGGAGAPTARQLSAKLDPSKYNLIVITARPYFAHLVGSIRASVTSEGNFAEQILMPYDKLFIKGNGKIVVGQVTSVTDQGSEGGYVTLASGEKVDYSVLILTPGSIWDGPVAIPNTKPETLKWFGDWRTQFEKANDILLVGGGSVGVEFAGEIKDLSPTKKVTIIHSQKQLLNGAYPDKFRKDVERRLQLRGVHLILGDYAPEDAATNPEKTVTTRNGKELHPDLVISCRGPRPNTSFIASSLGAETLNASGFVKIAPTFQLKSHPRIFAAGDITDLKEQKQVGKYRWHAPVVAANVLSVLEGKTPSKFYKGSTEMIVITIGKNGGAAYFGFLWGLMFGDWISSLLKSKNLMIGIVRSALGLEASD